MSGINTRAVVIGALVDNAGTLLATALFDAAIAAATGATSPEDLTTIMDGSVALWAVQILLGLSLTAAGAYVAAMLAKGNERPNAFAVGVLAAVVGFYFVFSAPESAPYWAQAAGLLLTIPAAFLGGEIRLALVKMRRP